MNKSQLIDAIAKEAKLKKTDAKKAIEAFIEVANKSLKDGERVSLIGLGAFTVVEKPARNGRNPKTGEAIKIEAKKVIKFKPTTELAEAIK